MSMLQKERQALHNVEKLEEASKSIGAKFRPRNREVQKVARFLDIVYKRTHGIKNPNHQIKIK